MILGIECTAHTFGIAVVNDGKILSNIRDMYKPKEGGIIPMESAKHHRDVAESVYHKALKDARISEIDINAIAISNAPGLAPCLIAGLEFAKKKVKELSKRRLEVSSPTHPKFSNSSTNNKEFDNSALQSSYDNISSSQEEFIPSIRKQDNIGKEQDIGGEDNGIGVGNFVGSGAGSSNDNNQFIRKQKNIPLIPVNHCIAHLEIGRKEGAKDPVLLYASGANTQIIAFESGKYRVFGETLDSGIGNFIDTFARHCGIDFPGGPEIERKAKQSKNFIELPYSIKGMDVSFSGMQTKLKQLYDKGCSIGDLSYSMQEHAFAMLVEAAERALAHTGKTELVLGGGVACNKRFQEMCRIMCEERGAKYFCPSKDLLLDNAAMIAFTGELIFEKISGNVRDNRKINNKTLKRAVSGKRDDNKSIKSGKLINSKIIYYLEDFDQLDISPRERTDDVEVFWRF